LGYHFIMRPNWTLDINYFMRSCDMVRHFRNDVYLASRLLQWVIEELSDEQTIKPGNLTMFISSLHLMVGDVATLRARMGR
jgi:thymidylate synthase